MKLKMLVTAAAAALCISSAAGTAAGAADLHLWRLDCGTIKVKDLSLFSDAFDYAGTTRTLTDSCYLIQHDKDYLLWDTGLPAGLLNAPMADQPMSPTLAATLPAQLEKI